MKYTCIYPEPSGVKCESNCCAYCSHEKTCEVKCAFLSHHKRGNQTANICREEKAMSILDRKRELEWGEKNRARGSTLIVYKATPEEIEKLKGASDMGRPAGSKNKKNHSGIEIMPNDKKSVKPLNKRREELAKKLEVGKEEEKHEMNETHFVPPPTVS